MDFYHNNVDTYTYKLLNNNECFYKNIYVYLDLQLNFIIDNKTLILFIYILIILILTKNCIKIYNLCLIFKFKSTYTR